MTGRRITGVITGDGIAVTGDVVVDATGRAGRGAQWLAEAGLGRVREARVDAGLCLYTYTHTNTHSLKHALSQTHTNKLTYTRPHTRAHVHGCGSHVCTLG